MKRTIPLGDFARYWLRLGCVNFAGGPGQTARMRRELVDRGWLDEARFGQLREACELLPGPQSFLLAVCLGRELRGWPGGVLAGCLAVLPGMLLVLGLSWPAAASAGHGSGGAALAGLAAAGTALAVQALWRYGRARLAHPLLWGFAAASFLMSYALRLKFPGIVVASALMGAWLGGLRPDIFAPGLKVGAEPAATQGAASGPDWKRAGRLGAAFAGTWLGIAGAAYLLLGADSILPRLVSVAMRAGMFSFGGAWGVLASMADVAQRQGWIAAAHLAPGLGLASAAPGPLALVAGHAGFMAGWGAPGALPHAASGLIGGLLAVLGVLFPGMIAALAMAPHAAAFSGHLRVRAAAAGIGAAMVGVLLKLCLLFGLAIFLPAGPEGGVAWLPLGLFAVALLGLLRLPPFAVGPLCVLLGWAWSVL